MKKIFAILIIVLTASGVYAKSDVENDKNAIFLDLSNAAEVTELQKGRVNMDFADVKYIKDEKEKQYETLLYKDVNHMQPEKKAASKNFEKEIIRDTSVGASYSTTEKSGKLNDTVSVYSKYQKENFGLTTSYSQDREGYKENGAGGGSVSIAPEVSLNEHVKIKNVYSENLSSSQQKSEFVLSLRPFKDDRMDLDLGAGQTFSNGNEPAKSQIKVGTKFRF